MSFLKLVLFSLFILCPVLCFSKAFDATINLDYREALKKATDQKKLVLIYFYGIWCPPCLVMDENVFPNPVFKKASSKFIFLKIDSDAMSSNSLLNKFEIQQLPAFVFITPDGKILKKIEGYVSAETIQETVKSLLPIDSKQVQPDSPAAVWAKIQQHYDNSEYDQAVVLLPKASRQNSLSSSQKDLLTFIPLMANFEKNQINEYLIDALKSSLNEYFDEESYYKKYEVLESIAAKLNHQTLGQWLQHTKIQKADKQLKKNPKSIALLSQKAKALETLGRKKESKELLEAIVTSIRRGIPKQSATKKMDKGYNLELALALQNVENFEESGKILTKLVEQYPDDFVFHFEIAYLFLQTKSLEKADLSSQKALSLSYGENKIKAVLLRAEVLNEMSKSEDAKAIVEATLKEYSNEHEANPRLARHLRRLKNMLQRLK